MSAQWFLTVPGSQIYSDSMYAIRCCTSYGLKNYKNGWNKDIPNKKLVRKAFEKCYQKSNIRFTYVPAHTNETDEHSIGNDKADKLRIILYRPHMGLLMGYNDGIKIKYTQYRGGIRP